MNIGFLYPLVWLGAAAIGIPLWLHLRRRPETRVIRFSALQFLQDQPLIQHSPLRIHDVLLLLLRLLVVSLLVAAFAWPYRRDDTAAPSAESRVDVLDNTLSHGADKGFQRARDGLAREMARAPASSQIAVVELTARPRVLAGFEDDRGAVGEALASLEPSAERGSYAAALRQADALLAKALGTRRRIFVWGDSQENQWSELVGKPAPVKNAEVVPPEVDRTALPNLALHAPKIRRTFAGDAAVVELSVEVYHQGPAKTAHMVVQANGREVVDAPVDLAGRPERVVATARWSAGPLEGIAGQAVVSGKPDALAGDNRVYFALPPVDEGRVALLSRSPFLRTALSPDVMRGLWTTEVADSPAALADTDADVLCIDSSYLESGAARDLVARYLGEGRGVLLLLGECKAGARGVLQGFGLALAAGGTGGPTSTGFGYVLTDHPVFEPFRSPDFGNLTEIQVRDYRRLKAEDAVPLVLSQDGDPLLVQPATPAGRLLVCGFKLDREETNWPIHPTFVPFLDLCLQYTRGQTMVTTDFEPGDTCVLDPPRGASGSAFTVRSGDRELVRGTVSNQRVEFACPAEPGLYTLTFDSAPSRPLMIAVNPSPLESELKYLKSPEIVRSWAPAVPSERRASAPRAERVELTRSEILRQRIWWFLLLAASAALVVEACWLAAREVRRG